jgi:hypothetical protein
MIHVFAKVPGFIMITLDKQLYPVSKCAAVDRQSNKIYFRAVGVDNNGYESISLVNRILHFQTKPANLHRSAICYLKGNTQVHFKLLNLKTKANQHCYDLPLKTRYCYSLFSRNVTRSTVEHQHTRVECD